MAADEIERFRREIVERTGDARPATTSPTRSLLREVMNTVGKAGQLGGGIRCVVSVSMLTEGWDANTVTHVLGIRAFGTQLLCEQVIGRALRRQSYDLNEEGLFNVEYADVFGIPFDFTAKPVIGPPQPPRETVTGQGHAPGARRARNPLSPRRGLPRRIARRTPQRKFQRRLHPDPQPRAGRPVPITRNSGIIGEGADMSLKHLGDMRPSYAAVFT
jgi:type III restriction enzyme